MPNGSEDARHPQKWTAQSIIAWIGGIVTLPAIGWFLLMIYGKVDNLQAELAAQNTRLTTVEKTNVSAIWDAISKNRDADIDILRAFNQMAVKYEAAMIVFDKHHGHHSCLTQATRSPASLDEKSAIAELMAEMLAEIEKAEGTDRADIERMRAEIQKLKEESNRKDEAAKKMLEEQRAFYEQMKQFQAPEQSVQGIDPKMLRESYEKKTKD